MQKIRQSNIELLRILAMFMICVIHANMVSLPHPNTNDLLSSPIPTITRYFIESLGIVGVNIFVFISGWFTINTRKKSFYAFFFQILFLWGGSFLLFWIIGLTEFNLSNILEIFAFSSKDWFIKSYIVLLILAPILNTFLDHSSENLQRNTIICFFLFTCTYGWFGGAKRFFVSGYTPLLFIGLYLLSHYVRYCCHQNTTPRMIKFLFSMEKKFDLAIFFTCAFINTFLGVIGLYFNKANVYGLVYAYSNPFTIIGALYLLLYFSKLDIQNNNFINYFAKGSFAVYLLHSEHTVLRPLFTKSVCVLYNFSSGIICIVSIFIFLFFVYIVSVIIDRPRILLWNFISNKYNIK